MKCKPNTCGTALLGILTVGFAAHAPVASASSHSEARFTASNPQLDDTDLYAFRDWNDPTRIVIIANRYGLIEPQGGPNFAGFADGTRYEINIDNDGNGISDYVYRFTFKTTIARPGTFLYNDGPVTSVTDPDLNVKQTYTLEKLKCAGAFGARAPLAPAAHCTLGTTVIFSDRPVIPANVGIKSFPNGYANLTGAVDRSAEGKYEVFVGQRQDGFFVDLGMAFDLINLEVPNAPVPSPGRPGVGVGNTGNGKDTLYGFNVLTTTMSVDISEITKTGTSLSDATNPDAIVGLWSSISVPRTMTLNDDGSFSRTGDYTQVSRLGNPLVNELLNGIGQKDLWNRLGPSTDVQFRSTQIRPILAVYMNVLFGIPVPPPDVDRVDIEAALFKGVPAALGFLTTRPNEVYSDQLRLNTAIPATPFRQAKRLAVLAGDLGGFPNGRRPCDDVVDIELRVVAGVLAGPAGVPNGSQYSGAPNNILGDGVDYPTRGCREFFPYQWAPTSAFAALHASGPLPAAAALTTVPFVDGGFTPGISDEAYEKLVGGGKPGVRAASLPQ